MSSTSQVTTFLDLYTDLQNRVREATGETATQTIAKRFINIGFHDMHVGQGEKFYWAERRGVLVTQPEYNTGIVSVSQGSNSVIGSGTAWNTANVFGNNNVRAKGKIVIDGGQEVYEVAAVSSDVGLALSSQFTQADKTAVTYRYFEDEYSLGADFLKPVDQQFFDENSEISLIGRREFRMRYPRNNITGKPLIATMVTDNQPDISGSFAKSLKKIKFWKPPNEAYSIPYAYVTSYVGISASGEWLHSLSADDDEPIIPLQFRHAIVFHALSHYYRDIKDDARSAQAAAAYTDIMARVISDQEIGSNRPQLRPRVGHYKDGARSPYKRKRSHRYTTGSRFDEIR